MTPKKLGYAPWVTIEVTDRIINAAVPKSSSHCIVAEAVRQQIPNAQFIAVDLQTIRWSNPEKDERYTYLTPRIAQVALVKWDQGATPEPFKCKLRNGQTTRRGHYGVRLNKLEMRRPKHGSGSESCVPDRVGGRTPPIGALASGAGVRGARRAFGLRALVI